MHDTRVMAHLCCFGQSCLIWTWNGELIQMWRVLKDYRSQWFSQSMVTAGSPARSQSMSCCSLREIGLPVDMDTMHSVTPIVAKAQQQPQADPFTCWFLMGPTMSLVRQSTAAGGLMCS